jgi:sulfotransferase family protein
MLPNFLVIGSMKAGTSSLYQYLRLHPQVFMAEPQELNFFFDPAWSRGVGWYEKQFAAAGDAVAIGNNSPACTMQPRHGGAPERAHSVVPDARLVYLIRHPVERMVSHYHHRRVNGNETRPIETALREEPDYLDTSRYAYQIERWLEFFPREQLLVVTQDEMRDDRRDFLRRVYAFIGADPDWWSPQLSGAWNVSEQRQLQRPLVKRLLQLGPLRRAAGRLPQPVDAALRRATHRKPPEVEIAISEELEAELADRLRPDVARLRAYMDSSFTGWGIA